MRTGVRTFLNFARKFTGVFPHEHLLVALLPVMAYVVVRDRHLPTRAVAFATAVGSQFPDLVDKPLAHQFDVLPSGRVFIHSLPFALPIAVIILTYGWYTDRPRVSGAFVSAYLLHLGGDTYQRLLVGEIPSDLLWPFAAAQSRPKVPFWAGVNGINVRFWSIFSVAVLATTLIVVVRDVWGQVSNYRSEE
ncbi:metal-dependent hydrolase [Halorubrum ezzemoulense]|uniref:metal-dependent hydrolase n=1 Tax=Halorubrum ezzemoulense TaxID=337243 RepID=UPI00232AF670|nr:metal-dependent hydrolase [Halorubrum ezzemoulense]MDB9257563.1 metal-dependent hydrolase [Halorubrum ezzemoulense]MDB9267924.1 metal-dependent hydrolase [Halorubrum ezzemoulense]MDB9272545.1 metal-dependent hydrolase [Halorubrum ezzemoulense]MDB9288467.1 metal-dependent hydrolase [Halorubrum ezzemoulense]MDB9292340.1 metal-dependent hydrolase [Halorubrum ezzemoulense]